ncbi:hypothetical protein [Clostridium algidicarnis]|uniref:hypothetical protein n=1 Tax=Clostridium algidicarnis TaxID=37659 RepID=UPI001C0DF431|nr:hypothetical protein [Clostridium algidicarnis]MBU3193768.1 hypothetical protein [Clostridium algidicarnis]MBU3207997.1 hypothetical protein [Clostridium algidicarnis]
MKDINIKKVYVFTLISFVVTTLFLYLFAQTGPHWYTGWDSHTSKNTLSIFADIIFIISLLVNCVGIILSIIYTCKSLFNKFSRKL